MHRRDNIIQRFKDNPDVSVLIIGAGINGIGTYRDLALQGVDVLIVERDDFCSGASSASSHMLHGGIRYLENGEFRLVREALTERNLLLRNAPHYAKPLPTTIPIFKYFSGLLNAPLKFIDLMDKPAERGAFVIKIGMTVYDIFARNYRVMPTHRFDGHAASMKRYPALNPKVRFTGTYYDAWMPSPERIAMDLIRDADQTSESAFALNYVSAQDAKGDTVMLYDAINEETFTVKPKIVINAGGPWIDFVNRAMGKETKFIGGTKGSHLILENPALYEALNGNEFFFENHDGRILLILPYMGKVMVGTTDIRIEDPDDAVVEDSEIDYIFGAIPTVFPNIPVDRSQIIFQFVGVRPLAASEAGYTGNVTRDHQIKRVEVNDSPFDFPIYSLVGGKWTSFRAFSEQTTDAALHTLGRKRKQSTAQVAIGGGHNYPKDDTARQQWLQRVQSATGVPTDRLKILFERYGTHAETMAQFITEGDDHTLEHHVSYSSREISYLIQSEQVTRLTDIVLRRSLMAWMGEVTTSLLEELAAICAQELNWSDQRRQTEIDHAVKVLSGHFGCQL